MRISELRAATGVSPRSLRYDEQQGLITAGRSTSAACGDVVARVAGIRDEIAERVTNLSRTRDLLTGFLELHRPG